MDSNDRIKDQNRWTEITHSVFYFLKFLHPWKLRAFLLAIVPIANMLFEKAILIYSKFLVWAF